MGYTKNVREIVEQIKLANKDELEKLRSEFGSDPRVSVTKAFEVAKRRIEKQEAEIKRVEKMYDLMREAGDDKVVMGIDEVGRGPIAGPLSVAAVVLPNEPIVYGLNDSKQLSPKQREEVAKVIRQRAIAIGIAHIPPQDIDKNGITASLKCAMLMAIDNTGLEPDLVLIDGNPIHVHPREQCIVKGDSKIACIAAASIVAKVTRDHLMIEADSKYPGYYFAQNKGYGSKQHTDAIKEHGLSDFHRRTFCTSFVQETLF